MNDSMIEIDLTSSAAIEIRAEKRVHDVKKGEDGFTVLSSSGTRRYAVTVNEDGDGATCECLWMQHNPHQMCSHALAVLITLGLGDTA